MTQKLRKKYAPLAAILALLAAPALAWDFSPFPVCTLTHEAPSGTITVAKDLSNPVPYTIAITRPAPWPEAPTFSIDFQGNAPLRIGTDRHALSNQGHTLSVSDTGFGNVLAGLKFNSMGTAVSGAATVTFKLEGAPKAVAAFEACPDTATS